MNWRIQNENWRVQNTRAHKIKKTCPEARSYKYKFINSTANAGLFHVEYVTSNVDVCGSGDLLQKI